MKKDKLINIRVTSNERIDWKKSAAKLNKTLTEFIRSAIKLLKEKQ